MSALEERKEPYIPERDPDSAWTPEDVARFFQVPVTWVYGRCRPRCTNPLPFYKAGQYLRFDPEEVKAWKKRQKQAAEKKKGHVN